MYHRKWLAAAFVDAAGAALALAYPFYVLLAALIVSVPSEGFLKGVRAAWGALLRLPQVHLILIPVGLGFVVKGLLDYTTFREETEYLRGLFETKPLKLKEDEIPKSSGKIFLGDGFEWDQKVAQTAYALVSDVTKYAELERLAPLGALEGEHIVIQPYKLSREHHHVFLKTDDLEGHMMIVGATGCGKSKTFEVLMEQVIARPDLIAGPEDKGKGNAVIIIDPKGTDDMLNRAYWAALRAKRPFRFFSLAHPQHSETMNPVGSYVQVSEVADRLYEVMPGAHSGGEGEAFLGTAKMVIHDVAEALDALGEVPTIAKIMRYGLLSPEKLGQLKARLDRRIKELEQTKRVTMTSLRDVSERMASHINDQTLWKMLNAAKSALTPLCSGDIGPLLNEEKPTLTWDRIIENREVVYMWLGSSATAFQVGKMILADFEAYVRGVYAYSDKKCNIFFFIDEFYNVVSERAINILNKARGAGVKVIMAMQTTADLEAGTGQAAMARQVLDNANIKILMRVPNAETIKSVIEIAGTVLVTDKMERSTVQSKAELGELFGSSLATQYNKVEVKKITPAEVGSLPVGQGFFIYKGKFILVRFPLLPKVPEEARFRRVKGLILEKQRQS